MVTTSACGGGGHVAPAVDAAVDAPPATDDLNDPDVPPRGEALLIPWLAAGHYKAWACEPAPHPEVFPSNHGDNRTCNNSILHTAPPAIGNYPLDSASVKELYADDDVTIIAYAVSRKINDNLGDGWYWFENKPGFVVDGQAVPAANPCTACHQCARRDFTFAVVP